MSPAAADLDVHAHFARARRAKRPGPLSRSMPTSRRPSRPPIVLIASDQDLTVRSLESVLGPRGYAVLRAYTGSQVLTLASSAHPDALVLDYALPEKGGIAVIHALRDDQRFPPNVPLVMMSPGGDTRRQRNAAFDAGAWEFCTQPVDMEVLLAKLDTFVRSKISTDLWREQGLIDLDTGLYNAQGLVRRARELGAEGSRRHDMLACVALAPERVDGEDNGPATSAEAPLEIVEFMGEMCRRYARTSDAVGRVGPADFAIIAPSTSEAGALRMIERLRDSFETKSLTVGGVERRIRMEAALASVASLGDSAVDAIELLVRAVTTLRRSRGDTHVLPGALHASAPPAAT